jgi:hypothetical protein
LQFLLLRLSLPRFMSQFRLESKSPVTSPHFLDHSKIEDRTFICFSVPFNSDLIRC